MPRAQTLNKRELKSVIRGLKLIRDDLSHAIDRTTMNLELNKFPKRRQRELLQNSRKRLQAIALILEFLESVKSP